MLTREDAPKTLRFADEREARLRALRSPRLAPLAEFVGRLRVKVADASDVPDFDPCDGGIDARALFLLEAPGGRAKSSGFVSRNNPDETARNSFELHREAALPREAVVLWNIVPWYVGSGTRIRPVEPDDLKRSLPLLEDLLQLLPRLDAIVLVGRKAQKAHDLLRPLGFRLFASPHPSPRAIRTRPGTREQIYRSWSEVAAFLARNH